MNKASLQHRLLLVFFQIVQCTCFGFYQIRIPNGENVPSPCDGAMLWDGVGHESANGGGARNVFGQDFKENGLVWDSTICRKDSDRDGMTNGQELGDPDCTWTPDSVPERTTGISHPGICEPLKSDKCEGKSSFLDCTSRGKTAEEFECHTNENGTFRFDVRLPKFAVPPIETTYVCLDFEFPADQGYHMVGYNPILPDNPAVHHIVLYGCEQDDPFTGKLNELYVCGINPTCRRIMAIWGFGVPGRCYDSTVGILVGGKGYRYASLQLHLNNDQKRKDLEIDSGLTIYLTRNLRPHNAGIFLTGQHIIEVPAHSYFEATGSCNGECTSEIMTDNVNIIWVAHHMHELGQKAHTELLRNGSRVAVLAQSEHFNGRKMALQFHWKTENITIRPGDEIRSTCFYKSDRDTTTYTGMSTSQEMCLIYLMYYPKENFKTPACNSYGDLSACEITKPVIRGCDVEKFMRPENHVMVETLCRPDTCLKECLAYVRPLKKDPCYVGDVEKFLELRLSLSAKHPEVVHAGFSKLHSCDEELRLEEEGMGKPVNAMASQSSEMSVLLEKISALRKKSLTP